MRLKDKVAIITGGTSGIGEATAFRFAKEGAKVAVVGRDLQRGQAVIDQIKKDGGSAIFVKADITNSDDVKQMVETTISNFGTVNILFNNAGIDIFASIDDADAVEVWDKTMNLNLKGVFLCSKYVVPYLRQAGGGVIINTGSMQSEVSMAYQTAYATSKGGVLLFTKALAMELAPNNIRVCCVAPTGTETPMLASFFASQDDPAAAREGFINMHPLKRIPKPEDIANAVVFLASDEAACITGTALYVDSGYTAQ